MSFFLHVTIIMSLLSHINGDTLRSSPVFITDYEHVLSCSSDLTSNPFLSLSESLFHGIIEKIKQKASIIVIFAEAHLCTEDISIKDHLGTPYYHLQRSMAENNAIYFPSVINPFKILSQTLPPQPFNIFNLRSASTKLKIFEGHKYFYIYFEDGKNETRSLALRRHDLIMREVYSVLRQLVSGPTVAIYTGKRNLVTRHALRFSSDKPETTTKSSVLNFYSGTAQYRFGGEYNFYKKLDR